MNIYDFVPDSSRIPRQFLLVLKIEQLALRPRIGGRFVQEWREARRLRAREPSLFEKTWILDSESDAAMANRTLAQLAEAFVVFGSTRVASAGPG